MWFWKKKKYKLTKEYDTYEETQNRMKKFEEKYGISSYDFYYKNCDVCDFEGNDSYLWKAYIECYLDCDGVLTPPPKEVSDNYDDNFKCSILEDNEKNIKKEKEAAESRFFYLQKM